MSAFIAVGAAVIDGGAGKAENRDQGEPEGEGDIAAACCDESGARRGAGG